MPVNLMKIRCGLLFKTHPPTHTHTPDGVFVSLTCAQIVSITETFEIASNLRSPRRTCSRKQHASPAIEYIVALPNLSIIKVCQRKPLELRAYSN